MQTRNPIGQEPNVKKAQRIATKVLYTVLVVLALWVMREFIPAVVWAMVIAIALWPVVLRLDTPQRSRMRSMVVALLLTTAVGLFVVLPFVYVVARTASEIHEILAWVKSVEANGIPLPSLVERLPFGSQQIAQWWQDNLARPLQEAPAMQGLHGDAFMTFSRHFGIAAARGLVRFGFMLLTLFFILQAGQPFAELLLKATRRTFGANGARLASQMAAAVRGTVGGLVVVGLGEGALLGVAYAVAGLPHAAALGLLTALAAMLPFCAPIVFGGAALWLFIGGATAAAIAVLVFGSLVVFIAEHFVRPILIGSATRLPFLLVLFGILGGAETFGLIGLFVGPALMTILAVLWREWTR